MYLALTIASYLTSDNDKTYFLKRKTVGHVLRIEGMRFILTSKESAENSKRTSLILSQKRLLEDILCIKLKLPNSILYCNIL